MTEQEFWSLVSNVDTEALDVGDEEDAVHPLVTALSDLSDAEVEGFAEQLARHLYAIDGREYADNAGQSGGSGDGFLYLRCFVVAKGQAFYERVKADPTKTPNKIENWCESLLSVPDEAWEAKHDAEFDYTTSVSYETGSNEELW